MTNLARKTIRAVDTAGNILTGATVEIRRETAGTPLASLFSDREGTTGISNPNITDTDGKFEFHVTGGAYRIDITSGGFTNTDRYVPIGLAAETDGIAPGVNYLFDAATADADPGDGNLRFDNVTPANATFIYINNTNLNGLDTSTFLSSIVDGGIINIQTVDNTGILVVTVNGTPTVSGDYYKIPVTVSIASAAGTFIDTNALGIIYTTKGADGAQGDTTVANISLPEGYITGLYTSTTNSTTISVTAGRCRDADDTEDLILPVAMTKTINNNWSPGEAGGGFPSGLTLTNDTTYHVFIVDSTESPTGYEIGFDTSLTATNLLADTGGTKYKHIDSIFYGTAAIDEFTNYDGWHVITTQISNINQSPTVGNRNVTLAKIPTGVNCEIIGNVHSQNASSILRVFHTDQDDQTPSATSAPYGSHDNNAASYHTIHEITDTNGTIRIHTTTSAEFRVSVRRYKVMGLRN